VVLVTVKINMQNPISLVDASPFLLILLGAVFVHACFQLSVSVLTLLSSHTIGRRLSNSRLLNLNFWYILGVIVMISLLQLGAIAIHRWAAAHDNMLATIVTFSVIPLVALLMALFYYRTGRGTQLWLPRPAAEYITARAKRTKSSVEAFTLGMTTAITELPFALAPLAIVAFAFQGFAAEYWLRLAVGYALAVGAPLIFVALYISSGHKISSVQRWRENAKDFLRWTSAATLLLLTVYVAVLQIGAAR
jgi:amino acid transporter